MTIKELANLLNAKVNAGSDCLEKEVLSAYAGDMLSDVLALGKQPDVLLTGLLNAQVIRTAEMMDTFCVVFLRGKEPDAAIVDLAASCGICVLSSGLEMYDACGKLFQNGIEPVK